MPHRVSPGTTVCVVSPDGRGGVGGSAGVGGDGGTEGGRAAGVDGLGAVGDAVVCSGVGVEGLGVGEVVVCSSDGVGSGVWAMAGSPDERTREPAARLAAAIRAIRRVGRIRGLSLRDDAVRMLTSCESHRVTDRDAM
ncbi:hypothetical protein GCM10010228_15370 [Streptomyces massasporeus]|nr:hypothetical protein GCM10010228_15370 [Streptomyces massasporeus]